MTMEGAKRKPGRPKGLGGTPAQVYAGMLRRRKAHAVMFMPSLPEDKIPQGIRARVAAAVAADPLHTISLLGLNWDGIARSHDWLVHAEESKITGIMLAAGVIGWSEANRRGANLEAALKRAFAEMLLQMVPA